MVSVTLPMPPPPTPITKRPSGVKRDSSHLDDDTSSVILTSSAKKLKVTFDDRINVRVVNDWPDKSLDLVKEEVRVAIKAHAAGATPQEDLPYTKLLQLLSQNPQSPEAPSSDLLLKYIRAFEGRVGALGECNRLCKAVISLSWLGRDEQFVNIYLHFLLTLATAHVKYTEDILYHLVAHFERLPASSGRLPNHNVVPRNIMLGRVYTAIHLLINRIPLASGLLCAATKEHFPHDDATSRAHLQYQKNVLKLAHEIPEVRSELLAFVVQRVVAIDVQIQKEIDELEEEEEERLLQKPTTPDLVEDGNDSDESDLDSLSESEMTANEEERQLKEIRLQVTKLDGSIDMLFEYYHPEFDAEQSPEDNLDYQELLSHFTSLIMINRSRHAQFIIFHFAQRSPEYAQHFVHSCIRIIFGNSLHSHRLTACAYLGSFLARASHITSSMVRDVFAELCASLEDMRRRFEPNCMGPDRTRYSLYYTVAQTLLYVFCFRWRDLVVGASATYAGELVTEEDILADGRDLAWLPSMKETFQRNIHSSLNPLKVCSPAIVGEFAKIANHLRFMYVFSILERNKRIRLGRVSTFPGVGEWDIGRRGTALDGKMGDAHHQLEAYFPFDPYQLPKSKKWLQGEYNTWQLPRGMRQDDDDNDDDDDENDDDDGSGEEEVEYDSDEESLPGDLPSAGSSMIPMDTISISS